MQKNTLCSALSRKRTVDMVQLFYMDIIMHLIMVQILFFRLIQICLLYTSGGRKSFRREELNSIYYLQKKNGFLVPYLDGIQTDLKLRD